MSTDMSGNMNAQLAKVNSPYELVEKENLFQIQ